jgi:hypothetical protein
MGDSDQNVRLRILCMTPQLREKLRHSCEMHASAFTPCNLQMETGGT